MMPVIPLPASFRATGVMWPQKRVIGTFCMGPDEVVTVEESATHAVYETAEPTAEGWLLRIEAKNPSLGVAEVLGRKYQVRWGFVDGEYYEGVTR